MKFICKKCGSTDYKIIEKSNGNGIATGLYCAKCGQWRKWLNKQEKVLFADDINDNLVADADKDKEIARLKAENAELKARLEKAEKALGLACWEMALLDICCQGCDNEGNCRTMFLDGGYKLKTNECERYWLNKAEQRLAELQKEAQKMKVTTCKSCGAKIVWIKTQNGRSMPCDAEQVEYQKNYRGSALVVTQDGEVVRGNIIKDGGSALVPTVDGIGYISHFATCPNADKHRRTRRNEKEAK